LYYATQQQQYAKHTPNVAGKDSTKDALMLKICGGLLSLLLCLLLSLKELDHSFTGEVELHL